MHTIAGVMEARNASRSRARRGALEARSLRILRSRLTPPVSLLLTPSIHRISPSAWWRS
jgi:hypothetical protein